MGHLAIGNIVRNKNKDVGKMKVIGLCIYPIMGIIGVTCEWISPEGRIVELGFSPEDLEKDDDPAKLEKV